MGHKLLRFAVTALAAVLGAAAAGCEPMVLPAEADVARAKGDAGITLRQAAEDEDPMTRSHAIEAMAQVLPRDSGPMFAQALEDGNPAVRFAAAMATGEVKHLPAKAKLLDMAKDKKLEPDKRVFCAVIYALHRLEDDSFTYAIGQLLFDPESEVRADAAMVMGKMGEPSATGPLKALLTDEQEPLVQLQIHESLAMLGDTRSRHILEAYIKGYYLDLRLAAIPAFAKVDTRRAAYVLARLLAEDKSPHIRVVAAGQLSEIGQAEETGYRLCLSAARDPEAVMKDAYGRDRTVNSVETRSLQRLAALSLGSMKRTEAVSSLHPLTKSPDGGVRVAAAMAIVRILGPMKKSAVTRDMQKGKTDKAEKPDKTVETDKPGKTEKLGKTEKSGKTEKPGFQTTKAKLHTAGAKD
jgi:HEAT repeat protein